MEILFVHGAGGWMDDQPLADELRTRLGVEVTAPHFPDDDMSAAAWRRELGRQVDSRGPDLVIVGHSFGASMALLHLADSPPQTLPETPPNTPLLGLALLAMPFWGSEGWQAEYALPANTEPPADLPIWLHHCRDDQVVPFSHLDRHAARLPHALIRRHDSGGHQLEGRIGAVADDLKTLPGNR